MVTCCMIVTPEPVSQKAIRSHDSVESRPRAWRASRDCTLGCFSRHSNNSPQGHSTTRLAFESTGIIGIVRHERMRNAAFEKNLRIGAHAASRAVCGTSDRVSVFRSAHAMFMPFAYDRHHLANGRQSRRQTWTGAESRNRESSTRRKSLQYQCIFIGFGSVPIRHPR